MQKQLEIVSHIHTPQTRKSYQNTCNYFYAFIINYSEDIVVILNDTNYEKL